MNDETASAPAEGEALPDSNKPSFASWAEKVVQTDVERVIAAVERWYAAHFHAAAVAGRAPITADDKAALIQHVADAVAPPATQE
jgi:hypothetical protein